MRKHLERKVEEYYFYGGGYRKIPYAIVQKYKKYTSFRIVGRIKAEIYFSPEIEQKQIKEMAEYIGESLRERTTIREMIINLSMLNYVKVSYFTECGRIIKLFIRTP